MCRFDDNMCRQKVTAGHILGDQCVHNKSVCMLDVLVKKASVHGSEAEVGVSHRLQQDIWTKDVPPVGTSALRMRAAPQLVNLAMPGH